MSKDKPLPEKYLKALALVEEDKLSLKDIAKACGINESNFYDLMEGTADNLGTVNEKFQELLQEQNKRKDREIRGLSKKCRKKTLYLLDSYLAKHQDIKKSDKKTVYMLTKIAGALSRMTPNVEIGSFVYQKGLSPEDIYAEFKRLSGLASDRSAVQGASTSRTGALPLAPGSGDSAAEEPEDPVL